jgi:hypothetical protein
MMEGDGLTLNLDKCFHAALFGKSACLIRWQEDQDGKTSTTAD